LTQAPGTTLTQAPGTTLTQAPGTTATQAPGTTLTQAQTTATQGDSTTSLTTAPFPPPLNPDDIPGLGNEFNDNMPLFDGLGNLYWSNLNGPQRNDQLNGVWSVAMVFPLTSGWFGIGLPNPNEPPSRAHVDADMIMMVIDGAQNVI
jgi:hypothetical protein